MQGSLLNLVVVLIIEKIPGDMPEYQSRSRTLVAQSWSK